MIQCLSCHTLVRQAEWFPTPAFTAYMLAEDIPFGYNAQYKQYMPLVPEDKMYTSTWAWVSPLVDKIKADLISLDMWDSCGGVCVSSCKV